MFEMIEVSGIVKNAYSHEKNDTEAENGIHETLLSSLLTIIKNAIKSVNLTLCVFSFLAKM